MLWFFLLLFGHILSFGGHMQHIRKHLPELLCLISELWPLFSLPVMSRPAPGLSVSLKFYYVQLSACTIWYGGVSWLILLQLLFHTSFGSLSLPTPKNRFCIFWSNFVWHSMMNLERIFLLFFHVVFKSWAMQNGVVTTLMFATFFTPLKCLVVSIYCYCSIIIIIIYVRNKIWRYVHYIVSFA